MKPFLFLYGDAPRNAKNRGQIKDLKAYEDVVVDPYAFQCFKTIDHLSHVENKLYYYINYWGSPVWKNSNYPYEMWQPSPGDIGEPDIKTLSGVHCYRINAFHNLRFVLQWAWPILNKKGKGIFQDDHDGDRRFWLFNSDEEKDLVWPGWRGGYNWNISGLKFIEAGIRAFGALRRKKLLVNGDGREKANRLFEGYGTWFGTEKILREARPGDVIMVKGIRADGASWCAVDKPYSEFSIGTSFKDVFKNAIALAETRDLGLSLAYGERPYVNGSTMNVHDYTNPDTWFA